MELLLPFAIFQGFALLSGFIIGSFMIVIAIVKRLIGKLSNRKFVQLILLSLAAISLNSFVIWAGKYSHSSEYRRQAKNLPFNLYIPSYIPNGYHVSAVKLEDAKLRVKTAFGKTLRIDFDVNGIGNYGFSVYEIDRNMYTNTFGNRPPYSICGPGDVSYISKVKLDCFELAKLTDNTPVYAYGFYASKLSDRAGVIDVSFTKGSTRIIVEQFAATGGNSPEIDTEISRMASSLKPIKPEKIDFKDQWNGF